MQEFEPVKMPEIKLETARKYTLKQELDIKKDNWMHFPMTTGLAVFAYDYTEKAQKAKKSKKQVKE